MSEANWKVLCTRCFEEEDAERVLPGSLGPEIMLFLFSIPLLMLPFFVYLAWRATIIHWACRVCHSKEIIPVASTRARLLKAEMELKG
jgi:hypothetical protein